LWLKGGPRVGATELLVVVVIVIILVLVLGGFRR
jgi:hypothetical protein